MRETKYFKRLVADHVPTPKAKQCTKIKIISEEAQEACYVVAEIMAKKIK
jgi:hypothetical protein